MSVVRLLHSETTKFFTSRTTWMLSSITVFGTLPMAWMNAASSADVALDDPRLFSAEPIPLAFQGFEMAGFGYVLIVVLASHWAGSEYASSGQIRTTLLATPQRLRVFVVKGGLLALTVAAIAWLTMAGTVMITHVAAGNNIAPWALTPAIWANVGGVTLAWTLTALITFAIGTLARTAIVPLILVTPLVIGVGDFLSSFWSGAKFLPTAAGAALYSDPSASDYLSPVMGGLVQGAWALVLLTIAAVAFVRRDV